MEAVVRQPHAETQRHQRIDITHGVVDEPAFPGPAPGAAGQRRPRQQSGGQDDQPEHEDERQAGRGRGGVERACQRGLQRIDRPDHVEGVDERAERQDHDQRGQVRPPAEAADAGAIGVGPQLGGRGAARSARRCRTGRRGRSPGRRCSPCCPSCAAGRATARSHADRRITTEARRTRSFESPSSGFDRLRAGMLWLDRARR